MCLVAFAAECPMLHTFHAIPIFAHRYGTLRLKEVLGSSGVHVTDALAVATVVLTAPTNMDGTERMTRFLP